MLTCCVRFSSSASLRQETNQKKIDRTICRVGTFRSSAYAARWRTRQGETRGDLECEAAAATAAVARSIDAVRGPGQQIRTGSPVKSRADRTVESGVVSLDATDWRVKAVALRAIQNYSSTIAPRLAFVSARPCLYRFASSISVNLHFRKRR